MIFQLPPTLSEINTIGSIEYEPKSRPIVEGTVVIRTKNLLLKKKWRTRK
jgi:hypothetical protein